MIQTGVLDDIRPQAIKAVDGDYAIDASITYKFVGGKLINEESNQK